jgi:hypothetical protein
MKWKTDKTKVVSVPEEDLQKLRIAYPSKTDKEIVSMIIHASCKVSPRIPESNSAINQCAT